MALDAVSSTSNSLKSAGIGQDEFLRLLLTQLQNQNPLKPVDNAEFVAQMAQFSSLAQTQQISKTVDEMLGNQAASQSIGLIGKNVDFALETGQQSSGQVTAVSFTPEPQLSVRVGVANMNVPLRNIAAVR